MSDSAVQISPRQRTADGLQIRYAETERATDETILLLNPWPESLFAWNTIWSRLAQTATLVAIDLPGFGQSEGRPELMSPRAMGGFLLRLISRRQTSAGSTEQTDVTSLPGHSKAFSATLCPRQYARTTSRPMRASASSSRPPT